MKESARQQHHRFDVKRLGEEIEHVCFLDPVAGCNERGDISREGGWITRHITDLPRSEFYQSFADLLADADAGRVQND